MKHIISTLFLCIITLTCHAQFFGYESSPFGRQQQQAKVEGPFFKGGKKGLERHLLKNFKNPYQTSEDRLRAGDGVIVVACIIDAKGRVKEAHLVRQMDKALNDEALRITKRLKFKPAKMGKKKVECHYDVTFPIRRGRLSFVQLRTVDV